MYTYVEPDVKCSIIGSLRDLFHPPTRRPLPPSQRYPTQNSTWGESVTLINIRLYCICTPNTRRIWTWRSIYIYHYSSTFIAHHWWTWNCKWVSIRSYIIWYYTLQWISSFYWRVYKIKISIYGFFFVYISTYMEKCYNIGVYMQLKMYSMV